MYFLASAFDWLVASRSPRGAFRPMTSIVGVLLVIEQGSSTDMFVGELSGDPDRTALLADNFLTGKEGEQRSRGG
jgi:hypothetical protein